MITEIIETAAILKDISDRSNGGNTEGSNMRDIYRSYKGQLQSISAKAAKNIAQFPVIMTFPNDSSDLGTSGLKRKDVLIDVSKFIECECARFLMTAAGLSPIVDIKKQTLGEKLSSFTGYSYSLESVDESDRRSIEEYYNFHKDDSKYSLLPETRSLFSEEADISGTVNEKSDGNSGNDKETHYSEQQINEVSGGINDKQPTVVNIKFTFSNGGNFKDHSIPIIVKASPYFVQSEEMIQYVKDISINSNKIAQLVRLKAKDLKFFKDLVFDYENIKRHRNTRVNIGRWPIARKLQDDTFYKKITAALRSIPVISKFIINRTSTMPKTSIVCSKNELAEACTRRWSDILKRPTEIYRLMEKSMLLSFSVIDWDAELVFTYFDGISEPYVNSFKGLAATSNTRNGEIKMMTELIKFMQIQQRRI